MEELFKKFKSWINGYTVNIDQLKESYYRVSLAMGKRCIAECFVAQFPGCCGIYVIHTVRVDEAFRGLNFGKKLIKNAIKHVIDCGGVIIKATTNQNSTPMEYILQQYNFNKVYEFVNIKKTGNSVTEWQLDLSDKYKNNEDK